MRYFALILIALLVTAGCQNPVEVTEEVYSENIMMGISDAPEGVRDVDTPTGPRRMFARMLLSLKRHAQLTDDQWTSVKGFAKTLAESIKEIRTGVKDETLSKEEAKVQLKEARETFVTDVTAILTEAQLPKFKRWLHMFWYFLTHRPSDRG